MDGGAGLLARTGGCLGGRSLGRQGSPMKRALPRWEEGPAQRGGGPACLWGVSHTEGKTALAGCCPPVIQEGRGAGGEGDGWEEGRSSTEMLHHSSKFGENPQSRQVKRMPEVQPELF